VVCGYWLLNSTLGFYLVWQYPSLRDQHPDLWEYFVVFSSKWIWALLASILCLLCLMLTLKVCCNAEGVVQNSIGAWPIFYIFVVIVAYMFSLYYGVLILLQLFLGDLTLPEENGSPLLRNLVLVFVLNEVVVGAYIVVVFVYTLFCQEMRKSEHLEELEGKDFGVREDQVKGYIKEI